jgi:hypothetical protein
LLGKGYAVNMSLKEIFLWLVALDFPSISAVFNWLINVPWWLAIITVYLSWVLMHLIIALAWSLYAWLNHKVYAIGQRVRYGYLVVERIYRHIFSGANSIAK